MTEKTKAEAQEVAVRVRDLLNRHLSEGMEAFVADMLMAHRSLQAMFTELCLHWLYALADAEHYDPRNRRAVEAARAVKQLLGERGWRVA